MARTAYLRLKGSRQGEIRGSVTQKGRMAAKRSVWPGLPAARRMPSKRARAAASMAGVKWRGVTITTQSRSAA